LVRNVTTDDFIPFIGQIEQIPPTYSAIKVRGKKMYEAAREGRPIEGKARNVTVYSFELQKHPQPLLEKTGDRIAVTIQCSSGTYIRALARDLGTSLGGGGYVEELRRTKIGPFSIDQATALERVVMRSLIPIDDFLDHLSHPDDPKPVSF
jgi:tRNA pseudouridine55 synthase